VSEFTLFLLLVPIVCALALVTPFAVIMLIVWLWERDEDGRSGR
jgi:hypothetical protein